MDLADLKKLIKIFETSSLSKIELERGDSKVTLEKDLRAGRAPGDSQVAPLQGAHGRPEVIFSPENAAPGTMSPDERSEVSSKPQSKYKIITAPMVGAFYRASGPTSEPFVEKGSIVEKGAVVCIIEAMKLMNEIECDISGRIVDIFPENGQPVEFGEALFEIDPS